jgi:hypothetical protein
VRGPLVTSHAFQRQVRGRRASKRARAAASPKTSVVKAPGARSILRLSHNSWPRFRTLGNRLDTFVSEREAPHRTEPAVVAGDVPQLAIQIIAILSSWLTAGYRSLAFGGPQPVGDRGGNDAIPDNARDAVPNDHRNFRGSVRHTEGLLPALHLAFGVTVEETVRPPSSLAFTFLGVGVSSSHSCCSTRLSARASLGQVDSTAQHC